MKKAAIKILLVDDEPDILEIVGYSQAVVLIDPVVIWSRFRMR